jgi:hypothetical protein
MLRFGFSLPISCPQETLAVRRANILSESIMGQINSVQARRICSQFDQVAEMEIEFNPGDIRCNSEYTADEAQILSVRRST